MSKSEYDGPLYAYTAKTPADVPKPEGPPRSRAVGKF
jgi:hypothetical protein